ncbi:MAG: Fic family protein [Planctomycetes bacterium]|nr:Fic family protein [Planctomycetota bacterium]
MNPVEYHYGKFPPKNIDWKRLVPLIGPANAAVAKYDGLLRAMPNSKILLSPLMTNEAVLSSRIEGTFATLAEVFEFEATGVASSEEKRRDIFEIVNYREAMNAAVTQLETIPLAQRILKAAHKRLMQGVRGENKDPGEFRRSQVHIGIKGRPAEEARFNPPTAEKIPDLIAAFETYLHENELDKLAQLAIVHAEFESIHPFLDGNGRIGRLLIPLFMVYKGLLQSPDFFISDYLESNRQEYVDRLLAVSRDDDWTSWCAFFLTAIEAQACSNQKKAELILDLYDSKKERIQELTHSQYAIKALDWFFSFPTFTVPTFVKCAGIPKPTAERIARLLKQEGILNELYAASGQRPAVIEFTELKQIAG